MRPVEHPAHAIIAPFSDVVTRAAIESAIDGTRTPLGPDELLAREVAVIAAWNAGSFADLKQRRLHAAEQSRQQILAGEVASWPDELRALAFFDPDEQADAPGLDLSEAESDDLEVFDDDADDDEDGLAL